jgi:hypothetical protein
MTRFARFRVQAGLAFILFGMPGLIIGTIIHLITFK